MSPVRHGRRRPRDGASPLWAIVGVVFGAVVAIALWVWILGPLTAAW